MEISVALLLLLVVLVAAFAGARLAVKSRRRKVLEERERQRRKRPKYKPRPMSSRGEMRAYDDPSTLAEDIPTMGRSPTTTHNPHGTVAATARSKSASAGTKPDTTGK
jgi:uncharacterized membrane protein